MDLNILMERIEDSRREFKKAMAEARTATDAAVKELHGGFDLFDENDGETKSERRRWEAADAYDMREGK